MGGTGLARTPQLKKNCKLELNLGYIHSQKGKPRLIAKTKVFYINKMAKKRQSLEKGKKRGSL